MPEVGSWLVEGIGEDFIPDICDISLVDAGYTIPDSVAFGGVREILAKTGIMAGTSSGVLVAAALRYCREQTEPKNVVTLMPDSGTRYMTKVFNDDWMLDQGFVTRTDYGDLRDIILHPHLEKTTVTAGPDDTLSTALNRAKTHSISQLPVMDGESIVGIIDEWDMLLAVYHDKSAFESPVSSVMSGDLEVLDYRASIDELMAVFSRDHVAIIMDEDNFLGIITRIDLINYLRKQRA
jgi:cystathionine beta-synthase